MTTNLIILPLIIPLFTAVLGILKQTPSFNRRLFFAWSSIIQCALALYLFMQVNTHQLLILPMGGWKAPFGITLTLDLLGSIMIVLATLLSATTLFFSYAEKPISDEHPLRLPLIQFLIAGIILSFTTGDFFNLFVAFEIFLIASYALLTNEASDKQVKFAYPYVAINILGGTLFLICASLFYSMFGTLNFAHIASMSHLFADDPKLWITCILLVITFGMKAGFFPMFYWLPHSYSILPSPIAALFAGLLTKVGIYTLIKVFGTLLPHTLTASYMLIAILAIPTMLFAILAALGRQTIKEILCFNLISHIGFMMMALSIFSVDSIAACIVYMVHHVIVIASLFLIGGVISTLLGTDRLEKLGNLWKQVPLLGILFIFQALSLAGLPPFSGFWGKLLILESGISHGKIILVAALIITSILTLLSMLTIWFSAFCNTNKNAFIQRNTPWRAQLAIAGVLVGLSLYIGLNPNGLITLSNKATLALLNKQVYSETVLKFKGVRFPSQLPSNHHIQGH